MTTEENPAQTIERLANEAAQEVQLLDLVDGSQALVRPMTTNMAVIKETDKDLHHIKATSKHQTLDSFGDYIADFRGPGTAVLVDLDALKMRCVLDGNEPSSTGPGFAGWCDHRAEFDPLPSAEWADFFNHLNEWITREDFAELVNRRLGSFTDPSAADLMMLAQHFNVSTSTEFSSGEQLASGARTLNYVEQATANAGGAGQITVPATLGIRVRPFYDSDEYSLDLGFRYRLREGELSLKLEYANLVDLIRVIFEDYVTTLRDDLGGDKAPPFRVGN